LCDPALIELCDPSYEDVRPSANDVVAAPGGQRQTSLARALSDLRRSDSEELPFVPCLDDDSYDPRKSEFIRPASEDEVCAHSLVMLGHQISKLEVATRRSQACEKRVSRHYESVLDEMKAQLRAGLSALPQRSQSFPALEVAAEDADADTEPMMGAMVSGARGRGRSEPVDFEYGAVDGGAVDGGVDAVADLAAEGTLHAVAAKDAVAIELTCKHTFAEPTKPKGNMMLWSSLDILSWALAFHSGLNPLAEVLANDHLMEGI